MNSTFHLSHDMLNAWIDGIVTNEERQSISAHLSTCASCEAELESLRTVKHLLSELPEPVLPRSFTLTPEQARIQTPIREAAPPSTIVRILPIVRVLSIAAVLALLVLGGATAFGPVSDTFTNDVPDSAPNSVTNQASGASEESYPARRAIAPGEVIDQGQAASSSNSAIDVMGGGLQQTGPDTSEDLSVLEIATFSTGIFALIMVGLWVLLSKINRSRPTVQNASASQK